MELEIIILNEVTDTQKHRPHVLTLTRHARLASLGRHASAVEGRGCEEGKGTMKEEEQCLMLVL